MTTVLQKPHRTGCITIVIPTLLKPPKEIFNYSLGQYSSNDLVKRIVIIDNTERKEFDKVYPVTPKITVLKPPVNLGASVNAGMAYCDTDYYLQVNDDIICHTSVLDDCFDIMESDDQIGLLQMFTINHQPLAEYVVNYNNERKPACYEVAHRPNGTMTGWFQFGRKRDWLDIPVDLKNWAGDDLVILRMKHRGLKIVKVMSKHVSHMKATTVKSLGGLRQNHTYEGEIYKRIRANFDKNPR